MALLEHTDEDLIITDVNGNSDFEVLRELGRGLFKKGYVKESFIEAIIEREKIFPTGIENSKVNVAIPHTDAEHVLKPGLAIGVLRKDIRFKRMDDSEQDVIVQLVFVLALKNPEEQLKFLKELMLLIQDQDLMKKFCNCNSSKEVVKALMERK